MFSHHFHSDSTWSKGRIPAVTSSTFKVPKNENGILSEDANNYASFLGGDFNTHPSKFGPVTTLDATLDEINIPKISSIKSVHEGALATVIQIWEGVVISISQDKSFMSVKLNDRANLISSHFAEINLEWVVDQDRELVEPGAVFYWTIYKETKRGSISNIEEIRFRRLPNWTKTQLNNIALEAKQLSSNFAPRKRIAD